MIHALSRMDKKSNTPEWIQAKKLILPEIMKRENNIRQKKTEQSTYRSVAIKTECRIVYLFLSMLNKPGIL